MTIKLHVGYVGKTRDGKRVEIVECDGDKYWGYKGNDGEWYREDGRFSVEPSQYDIIGPWEDEPAPDYNNGKWHGWNGGECPVHPETVMEYCWKEGTNTADARQLNWNMRLNGLYAFRVVTPYVEPPKPREWWIYCYCAYDKKPDWTDESIHVREVLDT